MTPEAAISLIKNHAKDHPNKKELASEVGCSYNHLLEFIRGASRLSDVYLLALCFALDIDLSILKNDENPQLPEHPKKRDTTEEDRAARLAADRKWPEMIRWATNQWEGDGGELHRPAAQMGATTNRRPMTLNDSGE